MIPNRLSTLGHPQRLALFRLLMRRYPDRVPASEIALSLDLKPSTLSAYLNALMRVDLVTQERAGTSLRYSINMESTRETFDYLLRDCCLGRPDICLPSQMQPSSRSDSKNARIYNVLFVCTGNSARSIIAESILQKEGGGRFIAHSAGTKAKSDLNPLALDVLEQKGHDTSTLNSKDLATFQNAGSPIFDFVFTVCNHAANEECRAWPGQPISAHWGMPDPVKVDGSDAEKSLAFQQTYGALHNRIKAFTSLPIDSLDRVALQKAVDGIAATTKGIPT